MCNFFMFHTFPLKVIHFYLDSYNFFLYIWNPSNFLKPKHGFLFSNFSQITMSLCINGLTTLKINTFFIIPYMCCFLREDSLFVGQTSIITPYLCNLLPINFLLYNFLCSLNTCLFYRQFTVFYSEAYNILFCYLFYLIAPSLHILCCSFKQSSLA